MARPMPREPPVTNGDLPLRVICESPPRIPRVTTVAIIGAGELGGAVAQALAARESATRLVIVDEAATAAAGKALDIQQMCAITGSQTRCGAPAM